MLRFFSVGDGCLNGHGALVECYWQGAWSIGGMLLTGGMGHWWNVTDRGHGALVECYWQGAWGIGGMLLAGETRITQ
jgi:hypothetical protein